MTSGTRVWHHHHANSMCTHGGTVLVVCNISICSLSWKGNRVFKLLIIVELHLDVVIASISHNSTEDKLTYFGVVAKQKVLIWTSGQ